MLDHDEIERHGIQAMARALLFDLVLDGEGCLGRRCWDGWVLQNDFFYGKRSIIVLRGDGVCCFK